LFAALRYRDRLVLLGCRQGVVGCRSQFTGAAKTFLGVFCHSFGDHLVETRRNYAGA